MKPLKTLGSFATGSVTIPNVTLVAIERRFDSAASIEITQFIAQRSYDWAATVVYLIGVPKSLVLKTPRKHQTLRSYRCSRAHIVLKCGGVSWRE